MYILPPTPNPNPNQMPFAEQQSGAPIAPTVALHQ